MKIAYYICLLFSFLHLTSNAQNSVFEWAKSVYSTYTGIQSIAVDSSQNVYSTGYFIGTVDFDPGQGISNLTSTASNFDIFVQKLDSSGDFLWAYNFPNGKSYDMHLDQNGNLYITGYFKSTIDFDPGPGVFNLTPYNHHDIFILKLDPNGNFLWAKNMGTSFEGGSIYGGGFGNSITTDNQGNVYTTGIFYGITIDFNPGSGVDTLTSNGGYDTFIQKLDSNGNFIWAKSMGGSTWDAGYSISTDSTGNIITAGAFRETVDFDPGTAVYNLSTTTPTMYIQKLDNDGNFMWVIKVEDSHPNKLKTDMDGNIYTTGNFHGTIDFNPGPDTFNLTSINDGNAFIQKLDSNGNFLWAKDLGDSLNADGKSLYLDSASNIYITGSFKGTVDFDPGPDSNMITSHGLEDIYIEKLDEYGNFIWVKQMGGVSNDISKAITGDQHGNIYTAGHFRDTVDFDPGAYEFNMTSMGMIDMFIQKLSLCQTHLIDTINTCYKITWIDGNIYATSNNTATYTITDEQGCDVVVTLNLTIGVEDISLTVNNDTLMANQFNASYQWLNCSENYSIISGEINQNYIPLYNGVYAVEITQNGCIDTSACMTLSSVDFVDIEEYSLPNSISIYPNPTTGEININAGNLKSFDIKVFNEIGQMVYKKQDISSQYYSLNLNTSPGIYMIEISSKEIVKRFKIIKQ